jgi:hypothetical protein
MQAKVLVEKLGVEGDFNNLDGWLANFKKCHGIKCFKMSMRRPMWLMLRVLHMPMRSSQASLKHMYTFHN